MKERNITINLSIDEEKHEGTITSVITENGELKTKFTNSELASTLNAIHQTYIVMAEQLLNQLGAQEGLW